MPLGALKREGEGGEEGGGKGEEWICQLDSLFEIYKDNVVFTIFFFRVGVLKKIFERVVVSSPQNSWEINKYIKMLKYIFIKSVKFYNFNKSVHFLLKYEMVQNY